jgi:hypothetical protein
MRMDFLFVHAWKVLVARLNGCIFQQVRVVSRTTVMLLVALWLTVLTACVKCHADDKGGDSGEAKHSASVPAEGPGEAASSSESSASGSENIKQPGKASAKRGGKQMSPPIPLGGDPRGAPDLVVCSQNLKLFGTFDAMSRGNPTFTRQKYDQKVQDLVARFAGASCDVVAVQEVIGKTQAEGEAALKQLAERWRQRSNRMFQVMTAPPSEGSMTNGFIVALDRATVLQSLPYGRVQLPKIWSRQKPRLFSRPPFEVQLSVKARDSEIVKAVSIVNLHFKSKRGAQDDPTGLEWETYRMEMSEGLRRVLEMRHKDAFASGESILVVLGDRNSHFDTASARILEGSLSLSSFGEKGPCRLSKRGVPLCLAESESPRRLFSVLTANASAANYPGTYAYKGEYSWLDDIAMPAESLRYAWQTAFSEGVYASGVLSTPEAASDHALVYATLNW